MAVKQQGLWIQTVQQFDDARCLYNLEIRPFHRPVRPREQETAFWNSVKAEGVGLCIPETEVDNVWNPVFRKQGAAVSV